MSAQRTDRNGRSWTTCLSLRIRRLGVRVPPGAPLFPQLAAFSGPCGSAGWPYNWPHIGPREPVTVRVNTGESGRATVDGQQVSVPKSLPGRLSRHPDTEEVRGSRPLRPTQCYPGGPSPRTPTSRVAVRCSGPRLSPPDWLPALEVASGGVQQGPAAGAVLPADDRIGVIGRALRPTSVGRRSRSGPAGSGRRPRQARRSGWSTAAATTVSTRVVTFRD
jgi:hypothetical protein